MTAAATTRRYHLWSAGSTYHGAHSVLVFESIRENAVWYASQCSRVLTSLALNFQFFSG